MFNDFNIENFGADAHGLSEDVLRNGEYETGEKSHELCHVNQWLQHRCNFFHVAQAFYRSPHISRQHGVLAIF